MSGLGLIVVVLLVVLVLGLLPQWPYTSGYRWGYYPSGVLAIVLVIVLLLLLFGRI